MVGTYPASELLHQQYGLMGSYISEVCFSYERSIIEALLVYLQTDVLASRLRFCLIALFYFSLLIYEVEYIQTMVLVVG